MRKIILCIMQTRLYAWVLKNVIPYIRFTTYYSDFRGSVFYQAQETLKAGDYILTTDRLKLTSLLIPGIVDHAAYCIDGIQVAQMTHNDFTIDTLFDICKESTRVIIMRCIDFDSEYIAHMKRKCLSFRRVKYDVVFDLGVKALYCSELVYQVDFERRIQCSLDDMVGLGKKYISPSGLLFASNSVCVFDSDFEFVGLNGGEIRTLVEKRKCQSTKH